MLRAVVPLVIALGLTALGALTGWVNDASRLTAGLLELEPLMLVLGIWTAAGLRWGRLQGASLGVTLGLIGGTLGARLPYPTFPAEVAAPEWVGAAHRCATAIDMPTDPIRLLQWTLDGTESAQEITSAIATATPNVVVLYGLRDMSVVDALREALPSEGRVNGDVAILAAGGFHPCGDSDEWTEGGAYGLSLHFVGVPPDTVFPLVVSRFPGPFGQWHEREAAQLRVWNLLSGLEGASTVVVADSRSPRASRSMSQGFADIGFSSVAVPPNWPARMGGYPLLTVHPFSRFWLGPIWRVQGVTRAAASAGAFAPVLLRLTGAEPEHEAPREIPRRPLNEPALESAPEN